MRRRGKEASLEYIDTIRTLLVALFCGACAVLTVETYTGDAKDGGVMLIGRVPAWQLLWYAQRITNHREEAEDIVQEALMKGFRNLPRFRGELQMSTWLSVIVRNTAVEWLRNRKGRTNVPLEHLRNRDDEPFLLDLPDPNRNPEQFYEQNEMERILHSEIDEMNSVCKRAIQMCALEELSHLEAANVLGVSVVTIKSRIFNGKRMMKRVICLRTGKRLSMEPALLQSTG